jgi:Ca2+-binding RTX toxin-like protein
MSQPARFGSGRRAFLAALVGAAALSLGPGATSALAWTIDTAGGALVFNATAGEANNLTVTQTVTQTGTTVSFADPSDPMPTTTVATCTPAVAFVNCTNVTIPLTINLGDLNDQTTFNGVTLAVTQNGEVGDDTLRGPTNSTNSSGGPGTDRLESATAASSTSTLSGGIGPDVFVGGPGTDVVTYAERTAAVTVTIDGTANDGELNEGDNVQAGIEDVTTGTGNDAITGNEGSNVLNAGDGNDTLEGGAGSDLLFGGAGDDTLRARDGHADRVDCGPGADTAIVDALDTLVGCETVDRTDVGSATDDRPPTVAITSPPNGRRIPAAGVDVAVIAADDRGVARVLLIDDGQTVGTDTTAPYTFRYQPTADDVGRNTLIAVAVDTSGQAGIAITTVRVDRFAPRGLTARVTPSRDRFAPYRFRARGTLQLPAAVTRAQGCGQGIVSVQVKRGTRTISTRRVTLKSDCSYSSTVTFTDRTRLGPTGRLRFTARFLGNGVLGIRSARTVTARAG